MTRYELTLAAALLAAACSSGSESATITVGPGIEMTRIEAGTMDESVEPKGRCDSAYRVIRGGSWAFDGNSARCGLRYTHRPQDLGFSLGFRLARSAR